MQRTVFCASYFTNTLSYVVFIAVLGHVNKYIPTFEYLFSNVLQPIFTDCLVNYSEC